MIEVSEEGLPKQPRNVSPSVYATTPTGITLFIRTFLPWQLIRFILISLKILGMNHKNEKVY